ncbi:MAG: hypothetical protein H6600_09065 [Flavobacteriales bacterium]|nr:hypothetical protein [Flavobacteriales bacterium]
MSDKKVKKVSVYSLSDNRDNPFKKLVQTMSYHSNGELISSQDFDEKEKLISSTEVIFNKENQIIEEKNWDLVEGDAQYFYKYNGDKIIERIDVIGEVEHKTTYEYKDQETKIKMYDDEGNLLESMTEKMDANGNLTEVSIFDERNRLINKSIYKRNQPEVGKYEVSTFNEKNQLANRSIYDEKDGRIVLEEELIDKKLRKIFEEKMNTKHKVVTEYLYSEKEIYEEVALKDENGNVIEFYAGEKRGKKIYHEQNEYNNNLIRRKKIIQNHGKPGSLNIKAVLGNAVSYLQYEYEFY